MSIKTLYVHIPFCENITGPCDPFVFKNQTLEDAYINRLMSQINKLPQTFETVYIGGGTPTELSFDNLEKLLSALNKILIDNHNDFTIEASPKLLDNQHISLCKKYGVNRFALSYDKKTLGKTMIKLTEHNIHNIAVDIEVKDNQCLNDLKHLIKLKPQHIALDDEEGLMVIDAFKLLEQSEYVQYESANFSLPGFKSYQNLAYYQYDDYMALGCGASQKIGNKRLTWTYDIEAYIKEDVFEEELILTHDETMFEFIMMNLHLNDGFEIKKFNARFNFNFLEHFKDELEKSKELIEISDTKIKASTKGRLHLFDLLENFI